MRAWAKMQDKSLSQRDVEQDITIDRVSTLPLNLYKTETFFKPGYLNSQ